MIPFPNKKYNIIYADPPWNTKYFKEKKDGFLSRKLKYPTLSDKEIINLPVNKIANDDSILFIWCIDSRIPILTTLMKSWGFTFKAVGFVWGKKAKTTNGYNSTFSSYTRKTCEFCFIGTKGKYLIKKRNVEQLILKSKQEHSRKPDCVRNKIIELCGDLSKIELFARERVKGWDCWGNEV